MNYAIFHYRDFRAWLAARFFSNVAKQMELLIVSWQVYEITRDPLALGFVGLAQGLPYVVIALWAGHAADVFEKRRQIQFALVGQLLCSVGLMLLSSGGRAVLLPVYALLAVASLLVSFEQAASSAFLQLKVPGSLYSRGIAWNLALYQAATIGGPILGGWIIAEFSLAGAYGVVVGCYAASTVSSLFLSEALPAPVARVLSQWGSIKEGLLFLKSKPIIWACMLVDMVAVFFGDVIGILPVFAARLSIGPLGLGVLRSAPALGSLIFSTIEAHRPFITISWRNFLRTVTVFGFCMIGFALAPTPLLAMIFLTGSGMADSLSVIIRQSIYQQNTPDHMRGRIASVSGIFIRWSNEMGAFESGLAARLMGPVPSVIFGGSMTLLVALIMKLKFRSLEARPVPAAVA